MTKHLRATGRAVAGIAVVSAALLVGAPPAHAGGDASITVSGGKATFKNYGEILTAEDSRKDGRCVRAHLTWIGAGPNAPVLHGTATACGSGTSDKTNLSIGEGKDVSLEVCYVGGGRPDQCSDRVDGTA
jgi:hypothetical protein